MMILCSYVGGWRGLSPEGSQRARSWGIVLHSYKEGSPLVGAYAKQ